MKQLRFITMISFIVLFAACKSKDKKTDQTSSDTTTVTPGDTTITDGPPPPPAPMGPSSVLVVRHKVANFDKWLPGYEGNDSMRTANGLHKYIIARGVEDSNTVLVAMIMDDVNKAKAMTGSKELKDVMKKAGVVGPPTIDFLKAVMNDTTSLAATTRLMVRHKVKDFDAWKKIYDADQGNRIAAGLTDRVLAQGADDDKSVIIVFAVADMAKAKAMTASPELKAKMDSAGVVGKPDFFYYKVVKKYQ